MKIEQKEGKRFFRICTVFFIVAVFQLIGLVYLFDFIYQSLTQ